MLAWSHGFQIAAINLQGRDKPVWLAQGFFQLNGNTGYVIKPDVFLPNSTLSYEDILNLPPKVILKVCVIIYCADIASKFFGFLYNKINKIYFNV